MMFQLELKAQNLVTWVESHDTYANDSAESTAMTDEQMKNGWAIVASRANSTPLYFNRPAGRKKLQGNMGDAGNDNWKDPDVVAINKFHGAMSAQDERLTKLSDNIIMIERGTVSGASENGVVIVNLGDTSTLTAQDINLGDGSYNNCATTGGNFTVSNGKISGTIPKGITVLYAGGSQEVAVNFPKVSIDKENCSFYDTLDLTLHATTAASASYSINSGIETPYTNGDKIKIGDGIAVGAQVKVDLKASNSDGQAAEEYLYTKKDISSVATVYFKKPEGWQIPYAYVYNTLGEKYNNAAWPGTKMIKVGDNLYKLDISGFTDGQIVFNDWFYGSHQTSALAISSNDMKLYDTDKIWKGTGKLDDGKTLPDDVVVDGTSKVYFQKPVTDDWNHDDVNIYFYGKGGPSWPGVLMTKVDGSTNLYTYTLPAGLEGSNVIFNVNSGKKQYPGSGDSGLTAQANSKMIYADGAWKEYVGNSAKLYFEQPSEWGTPYIYAYTEDSQGAKTTVIDASMTKDERNGLYTYTFDKVDGTIKVIFKDNNNNVLPSKDKGLDLKSGEIKIYDAGALRDAIDKDLNTYHSNESGAAIVYLKKPAEWANAYIHYWGNEETKWPGVLMKDEGNGLYSFILPEGNEKGD